MPPRLKWGGRDPDQARVCDLLAVTTLSFDIAGLEIFLPLTVGGRVVLASRETARDGARLIQKLADSGVTIMQATPATWRLLLQAGWQGTQGLRMLCGGESFPGDLAGQLLQKGACVWNLYGPTETTIWSVAKKLVSNEKVLIGKPIANTSVYILGKGKKLNEAKKLMKTMVKAH